MADGIENGSIALSELDNLLASKTRPDQEKPLELGNLPDQPPEIYNRNFGLKPSEFLLKYYGLWIKAGKAFRPQIRELDPKLMFALEFEYKGRAEEFRELLPNVSDAAERRRQRRKQIPSAPLVALPKPERPNELARVEELMREKLALRANRVG